MIVFSSRLVRPAAVVVTLCAVGLAGGCGGQSQSAGGSPQVASAVSEKPGSTPAAAPSPSERPLIRPDATTEERAALNQPWDACMKKEGANSGDKLRTHYAEASKKCEYLNPEEPWERAKRLDPGYLDKFDRWLSCAKSKGIAVSGSSDPPGFLEFAGGLPPDNQQKLLNECQMKAFNVT
jgi:hypothetical protein